MQANVCDGSAEGTDFVSVSRPPEMDNVSMRTSIVCSRGFLRYWRFVSALFRPSLVVQRWILYSLWPTLLT
jgi:hypothetical protein